MEQQETTASSPMDTAKAALTALGLDPETIVSATVTPGGIGSCDAYLLKMANGDQFVLKAQLPGSDPRSINALKREAKFCSRLANRLTISTPRVRTLSTNDRTGVILLVDYSGASLPEADWSEALYIRVADDLGRLHSTFYGKSDALAGFNFLNRRTLDVSSETAAHANDCWARVAGDPRFSDVVTPERLSAIRRWIESLETTQPLLAKIPQTVIHGDCHPGNVLQGENGALVWTNWSEVSVGRGPEDISFFYQRAEFAGGTVPWDAMITAYHASLQNALGQDISIDDIRRAAEASEWSVRLLQWPHYFDQASPKSVQSFLSRLDELSEVFGA